MNFRKILGALNLINWIGFFVILVIANATAVQSTEPVSINLLVVLDSLLYLVFIAVSAANTLLMITDQRGPISSIAVLALLVLGVAIALTFLLAGLNVDPGSTGLLYNKSLLNYIMIGVVAGAFLDLVDLIAVFVDRKTRK